MAEKGTLDAEARFLKGVGDKNAGLLIKLGLKTVRDVLWHFPRRLEDRRHLPPIMMLRPGVPSSARGRLTNIRTQPIRGGKVLLKATLDDGSGQLDLVWFNQPWVKQQLQKVEGDVVVFGMVKESLRKLEMASPEWEEVEDDDDAEEFARLIPVYGLKEGVPQWLVRKAARSAVETMLHLLEDPLPREVRDQFRLPSLAWAVARMHQPETEQHYAKARERIAFDEFLALQLEMQMRRRNVQQEVGISFPISRLDQFSQAGTSLFAEKPDSHDGIWTEVHAMLPFELTGAQKRVIGEVWRDMEAPVPMNRLVQGDVGSGKTAVAACAILAAVRCGYQAAMMAPTEILAEQHYLNFKRLFDPLGITVGLMAGKLNAKQKRKAADQAASGEAQVCIGTHAIIQEGISFHRLGLAVIDEQHRFGVLQRAALRQKGFSHPDVLVMTATPIPRTMTMAIYGDLDVSVIDELPPGRKPIKTHWKLPADRDKVYQSVRALLEEGRQAYFVCPMISENEKMQTQAAEELYRRLSQFDFPDYRVALLHGQLKPIEKEEIMDRFRRHEIDILVSTVVIEVGVDVPNASVMVIEDANRFGLSQLHQLRGRVGRGQHQSYCILIGDGKSVEAMQRLGIMVQTTDGFRIAEEDLKIRGPGDVAGTRQAGQLSFRVADLIRDVAMLERAKEAAVAILDDDPELSSPRHALLLEAVRAKRSQDAMIASS